MSSKSKRPPHKPVSLNKAVTMAMTVFLWAWVSNFKPSQDDMQAMKEEIINIRDSISKGNLKLWMIRDALKEEFDWEFL